jgi:glucose/arabinose dehydrogenase
VRSLLRGAAAAIPAFGALLLALSTPVTAATGAPQLTPHHVSLSGGRSFDLNLPAGFEISVAAQGLRRVRFLAKSPDGRIFVTDMYNLSDNTRGAVYILDPFDPASRSFGNVIPYLTGLRNPNSIAFFTDATGASWLYVALTDRLLRYRYRAGDNAPAEAPEVLATFPDYGLNYKYGGWHLTRTVVIGGNGKIYVSVGSSCNACEEKEEVRASVLEMDPDGQHPRHFARGLRNAVGMRWIDGQLFATDMGADHLGDHKPADTFYALKDGANYGWPYCFQSGPRVYPDGKLNARGKKMSCREAPPAYTAFDAHSSPLGFEYFDARESPAELEGSFLVALHGSTKKGLGHGYRLARVDGPGAPPVDFITGFLHEGKIHGRPVDILRFGPDAFLFTDDAAGVIYYVEMRTSR